MTLLPPSASRASIESEWPGALAWATRHGWSLSLAASDLKMRAVTFHPAGGQPLEFTAELDGYRALPPVWRVVGPGTDIEADRANFPSPGASASIFHPNLVLCAPWNRLAYKSVDPRGPHEDWGGPEGWLTQGGTNTFAHTLGEMLSAIDVFLRHSPGMLE